MTVNPAMPSFACERHGLFAGGENLEQAMQAERRGKGCAG